MTYTSWGLASQLNRMAMGTAFDAPFRPFPMVWQLSVSNNISSVYIGLHIKTNREALAQILSELLRNPQNPDFIPYLDPGDPDRGIKSHGPSTTDVPTCVKTPSLYLLRFRRSSRHKVRISIVWRVRHSTLIITHFRWTYGLALVITYLKETSSYNSKQIAGR